MMRMTISNSKWLVSILLLVCLILLLYFLGRKSVHTEITISADPEKIWSVLTDAKGYKEWNPVIVPIEGEFREGEKIKNQMKQPDGKQSVLESTVKKMIKQKEMNQYGGIPGVLTFDHKYLLEPVDGATRVTQHEEYRGIGVLFWDASWVEPAYRKVNEALKDRVIHLKKNGQK
jgi:hypothetical protein